MHLQPHWRHAFFLQWIFFYSYSKATTGSLIERNALLRIGMAIGIAFVFALVFGALAGTKPLAAPAVALWPISGLFFFLFANNIGADRVTNFLRATMFAALAIIAPENISIASGWTQSFPLALLMVIIIVFALYLLIWGLPTRESIRGDWLQQRRSDPGTSMAISILSPMFITFILITVFPDIPVQMTEYRKIQNPDGTFQDCPYCPRMLSVPSGTFNMGTTNEETAWATKLGAPKEWLDRENPRHEVRLRSFSMSATEVTREQFSEFVQQSRHPAEGFCYAIEENTVKMGGVRTWRDPGFPQAPDHPVVCVTHWDATEYVRWLSRITKHKYRLPSEAEWEYVARAGTATGRYWGWDDATACEFENVADNQFFATLKIPRPRKFASFSCSDGFAYTAPVGRFKPNAFGFYDMLGNVAEWTGDWWNVNYIGAPEDGSIWQAGDRNLRVFRGGAWIYYPRLVRSASRGRITATDRGDNVGFRVVRTD